MSDGLRETRTICPYCGVGCGIILQSSGDKVVGLRADPDHPVSRGALCPKGATAHEFVHHKDRLVEPQVRRDGRLSPASWEEALRLAAEGLRRTLDRYGPDAVAVISSARATVEENFLAQKFARVVLGTNQVDNCFRICHSATVVGLGESLGSGAMTNPIADLGPAGAKVFLVVGSNTPHSHPIIWRTWMKPAVEGGAKLIIVDPRSPDFSKLAALHLPIRPGTEVALFNAMAQHILAQGLEDRQYLSRFCQGLEELRAAVAKYPPKSAASICGIDAEAIEKAAELYAKEKPASIVYGLGVTEHVTGVDNVRALANLALLTGNVGVPGGGVNALRGQNNVQGATDMCRPETLPGYQSWFSEETVTKFEDAWDARLPKVRRDDFLFCSRYWERILEGEIRALYVIGSDPALTEGNLARVEKALAALDLLIVQEVFPSRTSRYAHVVFPSSSYAEKDGTFVNTERRVQRVRQAIPPIGQSRPDWRILLDLARHMGRPLGPESPEQTFEEIRKLVPAYAGITYARLDLQGGLHWPVPTPTHPGTVRLHVGGFGQGRARLAAIDYRPAAEEPDAAFPFLLTTGRSFLQYNAGTMTRRTRMEAGEHEGWIEVCAADADRIGVQAGDPVRVTTRRGSVEVVARVRPMREGTAWMPFHFDEAPANRLTNSAVDPMCGITELKVCAARLEPVPAHRPRNKEETP